MADHGTQYLELARSARARLEAVHGGGTTLRYRVVWLDDESRPMGAISFTDGTMGDRLERALRTFRTGEVSEVDA